eukprot:CAMPEP_0196580370 /NCGR_PEP_ID=MMETSP1081-20130531/28590_1 /TAXON_ID=36882 /ORGANISM="Pyramimonas amylifera, Strain CCMP720" /LENGTH=293 /DNA_ID=CAMNT_0041900221 /DNA_START=142 /DNA_END=1023 /DNA_ORIENTATION=-
MESSELYGLEDLKLPLSQTPVMPGPLGDQLINGTAQVLNFPACQYNTVTEIEDKDFMIAQLKAAPTIKEPFEAATFFCGLFPAHLARGLVENFPPDFMFENYKSKLRSCGKGGCRYSLSAFSLTQPRRKLDPKWERMAEAVKFWRGLGNIVFSREFESALWHKLGVSRKARRREFRILSDKQGFANGRIHTDTTANKIATMMFYLPITDVTALDYGTCLHTGKQWKTRQLTKGGVSRGSDGVDGENVCHTKFRFLPNTGFSFKVSPNSWHSAPNSRIRHYKEHPRNSILLNWY